jgi:hypothetical protein
VIVVAGLPVHHYRAEDLVAEAYAMVFLVESGFAQQSDVVRAFGRSVCTPIRPRCALTWSPGSLTIAIRKNWPPPSGGDRRRHRQASGVVGTVANRYGHGLSSNGSLRQRSI